MSAPLGSVVLHVALAGAVFAQIDMRAPDQHVPLCDGECMRPGIDFDDDAQYKTEHVYGELGAAPALAVARTLTADESIRAASVLYGVAYSRLSCLARLESTFNPNAQNGRYVGLFQFDAPTWNLTPYAAYPRTNGWASAHAAAYLIARGQGSRWPPLARC